MDASRACRGRWVLRKFRLLLVSAALNPQPISAVERANVKRIQLLERELLRKEKALTESGAFMILRIITLINEAVDTGSKLIQVCDVLNLTMRTIQQWRLSDGTVLVDTRPTGQRSIPKDKLTPRSRYPYFLIKNVRLNGEK